MVNRPYSILIAPDKFVLRASIKVPVSARSVEISRSVANIARAFAAAEKRPMQDMLRELVTNKETIRSPDFVQYIFSRGIADAEYKSRFKQALRQ